MPWSLFVFALKKIYILLVLNTFQNSEACIALFHCLLLNIQKLFSLAFSIHIIHNMEYNFSKMYNEHDVNILFKN